MTFNDVDNIVQKHSGITKSYGSLKLLVNVRQALEQQKEKKFI